jgi:hypothetical protein
MEVSFNLAIFDDFGLLTMPPKMAYAVGMDAILETRALNHVKRLLQRRAPMSDAFKKIAKRWHLMGWPDSEGEWVAPPSDLAPLQLPPRGNIDPEVESGDEADTEESSREHRAARDFKRPRAKDTRWAGRMRGQQ